MHARHVYAKFHLGAVHCWEAETVKSGVQNLVQIIIFIIMLNMTPLKKGR